MHCLADCLLATVIRVFFPTLSVSRLVCYKVTVYYTYYMHSTYVFSETLVILTEKNMRVQENPCCRDRCCSTVNCTYFSPMAQKLDLALRVYEIELVQISEMLTLGRLIRLRRRNSIRYFIFRRVCFATFREISEPAVLLQTYNTQKLQDSEIPSDTNERSLNVRVTWLKLLCLSTKVI